MSVIKNRKFQTISLLIMLFGIVAAMLFDLKIVKEGVAFSFYTLLGMFIPGCAIIKLLRIKANTDVEYFTYAIFLGYIVSTIEYFIVVPLGIQKYAVIVAMLISSASFLILKDDNILEGLEKDKKGFWLCLVVCVGYVGVRMLTTGGAGSVPIRLNEVNVDNDTLFWMGNTIEATHRFPLGNFRGFGSTYRYHYFTSLQLAVTSLVTGIKPVIVSQFFYYIVSSSMIVFGAYCVFAKCTNSFRLRNLAVLSLVLSSGMSTWSRNIYAEMLFVRPFALDYGIGFFLFVIFLFAEIYDVEKYDNRYFIAMIAFTLLCGIKANFAAIALVGIGLCSIKWVFTAKQRWKGFFIGTVVLLMFIIVFYFVTNNSGYYSAAINSDNFLNSDILFKGETAKFYEGLCHLPIPRIICVIIFWFVYSFFSHPMVFGTVYYQITRAFIRNQKISSTSWILFITMMSASWIRVFVGLYGYSETYFIYSAFPLGLMFILLNWEFYVKRTEIEYIVTKGCFVILMVISVLGNFRYRKSNYIADYFKSGVRNVIGDQENTIDYEGYYVTKGQIEGYDWISDNSKVEENILVVSEKNQAFIPGVWSERYAFVMEENQLMDGVFSIDDKILTETIEEYDVSYVLYVSDDIHNDTSNGLIVFNNKEVEIYKVK